MISTIKPVDYNDNALSLKRAIKDYRDDYYTGLTDNEKKAIEERIKIFINRHPIKTPNDRMILDDYIQRQFQQSGFKGQIDFMAILTNTLSNENQNTLYAVRESPHKEPVPSDTQYAMSIEDKSKITSKIITEYDGSQYMVTENKNGLRMKIKVSETITDTGGRRSGSGRNNVNGLADIYESNATAFSDNTLSAVSV